MAQVDTCASRGLNNKISEGNVYFLSSFGFAIRKPLLLDFKSKNYLSSGLQIPNSGAWSDKIKYF
jgi:hypothetical protein